MNDYQRTRDRRNIRKTADEQKINDGIFTVTFAQLMIGILIILTVYLIGFFKLSCFNDISKQYEFIMNDKEAFYKIIDIIEEKTDIDIKEMYGKIKEIVRTDKIKTMGQGGMLAVNVNKDEPMQAPANMSLAPLFLTAKAKSPLKEYSVTSNYGFRIHPISEKTDFHTGIDLAAPQGSKISAAYPGKVKETGESDIYGLYVVLEHANGLESVYCHCSEIKAKEGTSVRQGETIALVGSTGISTGPHLHFDIRVNGVNYDPAYALGLEDNSETDNDISV